LVSGASREHASGAAERVRSTGSEPLPRLTERQDMMLRAIVASYVGGAAPVGSHSLSHVLPVALSAASIRNTMSELAGLGLIEKPHRSAGRVPTDLGLRVFVDRLVPRGLDEFERRELAGSVDEIDPEALLRNASQQLSQRTRQLGFLTAPRCERLVLRHVSLVRLSTTKVLAVLVSDTGSALRCVLDDASSGGQADLERLATALNERVAGRTLAAARDGLAQEVAALRSRAQGLLERAIHLGWRALVASSEAADPGDLVIATRLALLDQPEFQDPETLRQLFGALETRASLLAILRKLIAAKDVTVVFGEDLDGSDLRHLALVVAPYGAAESPLGVVGVIGPRRMDYPRVVPLVGYVSRLVSERLLP
jgi:heat-inducible transcriptional repressor